MSETKNYQLTLTDDDQTKFLQWREAINGNSNSNMEKIDTALGEKADHSDDRETVLLASAWSETSPYTQTLIVEGMTATQNGVISIAQNITSEQIEAVCAAEMYISGQADNTLTIMAKGDKPNCDIPVIVILLG